jgi:hypothetical protein
MQLTHSLIEATGAPPAVFTPGRMFNGAAQTEISVTMERQGERGVTTTGERVDLHILQVWQRVLPLTLEMENEGGGTAVLTNIPFEVSTTSAGETVFSSERQPSPWGFSVRVNTATRQMNMGFTLKYPGLSVEAALTAVRFNQALARGGNLRILSTHPVTGGTLQLVRGGLPPETYEGPDVRFVEMLEQLAFIQDKTGVFFTVPDRKINHEDLNAVAATTKILETGHAQYIAEPWTSVSDVEQARAALETFASREPHPMALHFEDQTVVIFGTHVPLGPVTFFCDRVYITREDLETLRRDLEASTLGSTINVHFTPYEECPIEARYINWLPEEEAAAIRELPMYQEAESRRQTEAWALPPADVGEAVALLRSWYEEDSGEQREEWEQLRTALDEDRLSDRKLFL